MPPVKWEGGERQKPAQKKDLLYGVYTAGPVKFYGSRFSLSNIGEAKNFSSEISRP